MTLDDLPNYERRGAWAATPAKDHATNASRHRVNPLDPTPRATAPDETTVVLRRHLEKKASSRKPRSRIAGCVSRQPKRHAYTDALRLPPSRRTHVARPSLDREISPAEDPT
jgi:hypothetical protein